MEPCQANSLSLVRFDCNDYSVPTEYAHQAVLAIGGIERVRFVVRDSVVAEHLRDWGKENVHYNANKTNSPRMMQPGQPE